VSDDDKPGAGPPADSAKARKDERFERQARALRENLRRRNQQRRVGAPEPPDESRN
jgi:hypothetical protein